MRQREAGYVLTLLGLVLAACGIWMIRPPEALPADAPAERFSAQRAREQLEAIAREPHPMGTAEHARVRRYIVSRLEAIGLEPQLQETTAVRDRGVVLAGRVANVMTRLEGREEGRAVLLVSHYDTTSWSPGAGDDGTGVAAMLEALEVLRQGSRLRNDLIFLFTDGEEAGLLGAQAFVDQHPWARDVGVVLNFEARGTGGPTLMFETSPGNARLIRELSHAGVHPRATSYSYEVYKVLPNDTDFTVFRRAGLPGMNFSFIHGGTAYHTPQDSLARLDLDSLQHHGDTVLGLSRRRGRHRRGGGWSGGTGNRVYFNLLGSIFVSFSEAWVLPLAILAALATVVFLVRGRRRGAFSAGAVALAAVIHLLAAAALGALLLVVGRWAAGGGYNFTLWNGWTSNSLTLLALSFLAVAGAVAIRLVVGRKLTAESLLAGGLVIWLLLAAVTAAVSPGASYLFVLPLLLSLAAAFAAPRLTDEERLPVTAFALLALTVAVTTLLWAPTLALLGAALGQLAAVLCGVFIVLLLSAPLDSLLLAVLRRGWVLCAAVAALGLILLVAVRLASDFDRTNRRPNSVFYGLNAESGEALWASYDRRPDDWTSQFLSATPERRPLPAFVGFPRPMLVHPAPALALGGPEITWHGEEQGGGRVLELVVRWPWEAQRAVLLLRSSDEIRSPVVDSRKVDLRQRGAGDGLVLIYHAPPAEGIHLSVELTGSAPLELETVGQRYGLPRLEGFSPGPRPPHMMPGQGWLVDSTVVRSITTVKTLSSSPDPPEAPAPGPDGGP